jgi:hypothetical protein
MDLIGVAFLIPLAGIVAGIYLAAVLARRR